MNCHSNEDVRLLAERHPDIQHVDLSGEKNITEIWPLKKCPYLISLNVSYTGVEHCPITLIHCKNLERLDVSGTKVHTTTLAAIIQRTKVSLETLKCTSCVNVDHRLLRSLVRGKFREKIDGMLNYAEDLIRAHIERGVLDQTKLDTGYYKTHDEGPFWTGRGPPKNIRTIREGGCVCTGFIHLLMRETGIPLYHLRKPQNPPPDLDFGLGGCDEWLYTWMNKVEQFDENDRSYETGTLLLRTWNENDQGHVAMIIDDPGNHPEERIIAHTLGIKIGHREPEIQKETLANCILKMKSDTDPDEQPFQPRWDKTGEFTVYFGADHNGFTHVLRPQYWCMLFPWTFSILF